MSRCYPNILITGTPGTGKTTTAELVATLQMHRMNEDGQQESKPLQHLDIGSIIKQGEFYEGYDEELKSHILNEDKLLDALEEALPAQGGVVLDYHGCELFPERWFDLIVVLQTDHTVLYDRLSKRGYEGKKLQENIDCEIMQVITDEAMNSYDTNIVVVLTSNTVQDMESNVDRIHDWVQEWIQNKQL